MSILRSVSPVRAVLIALLALALAACGGAGDDTTDLGAGSSAAEAGEEAAALGLAVVHKSPTCDCCGAHEDYLAGSGFATQDAVHDEDLTAWKEAQGIPRELWSCHTTEVGGYFVEGHVPVETIERLLAEQPDIDGIALPGMPAGSPGMGGVQEEPLVVEAFVGGNPAGVFDTR
jgi:hypothetical protein